MRVPAPASVTCAWCGTYFPAAPGARCTQCGGPLPPPPGAELGERPPPAPRTLHGSLRRKLLFTENFLVMFGGIWTLVGGALTAAFVAIGLTVPDQRVWLWIALFPALFLIVGVVLLSLGLRSARKKLGALERGEVAEGKLIAVRQDATETMNGMNPWLLDYGFSVGGTHRTGETKSWDESAGLRRPGDPVWVVYNRDDPDVTALWPPHG